MNVKNYVQWLMNVKSFAFDETAGDTCIFFSDNTIEPNTVAEEWDLYVKN